MIISISKEKIIINHIARNEWCLLPYKNHKNGCPNYGKRKTCPPFAKKFEELVEAPFYLVTQEFDLEVQKKKMKEKHPNWTENQSKNLLYWQKGLIKKLKDEAYEQANVLGTDFIVLEVPEANGVNVFQTCKNVGIILEKNPQKKVIKVMVIGKKKK